MGKVRVIHSIVVQYRDIYLYCVDSHSAGVLLPAQYPGDLQLTRPGGGQPYILFITVVIRLEIQMKVKTPTRVFSWLKAPTRAC